MKRKANAGFSLVEVLVSMAILTAIVIPVCTALVMSTRMNARSEQILQARLAVSSTVEQLMADGIDPEKIVGDTYDLNGRTDVVVKITDTIGAEEAPIYYKVSVQDCADGLVSVNTCIRAAATEDSAEPSETTGPTGGGDGT